MIRLPGQSHMNQLTLEAVLTGVSPADDANIKEHRFKMIAIMKSKLAA